MSFSVNWNKLPIEKVNTPSVGKIGSIVDRAKDGTLYNGFGVNPAGMIIEVDTFGWSVLCGNFEIKSSCVLSPKDYFCNYISYNVGDNLYVKPEYTYSSVINYTCSASTRNKNCSKKIIGKVISHSCDDWILEFNFNNDDKSNVFTKKTYGPQRCIKCLNDYPYAEESNQPDGTFKCWGCRNFQ